MLLATFLYALGARSKAYVIKLGSSASRQVPFSGTSRDFDDPAIRAHEDQPNSWRSAHVDR